MPDPILLPNLHDGLEAVRPHFEGHKKARDDICCVESWSEILFFLLFLQQNAKKRKLEDGGGEDMGEH